MKDDTVYLHYILECIGHIEQHVANGRETFVTSQTRQGATLCYLQTMTEATQQLSVAAEATQPHIPWQQIAAFCEAS